MTNQTQKSPLRVEAQHVGFFETPIAYCRLKDGEALIRELVKSIGKNQEQADGLQRSNFGGWHSDTNMLEWGGDAAKKLSQTAINVAKRMTHFQEENSDSYEWHVRMWANVMSAGGLNHIHAHPDNLWAAVLYLDMGDEADAHEDVGGALYIEDPRFPMNAMHNTAVRMIGIDSQPQQYEVELKLARGNLVVFPAWLRHGVRPYSGRHERISIAMNIDARRRTKV
jgi:uncharacterized protein (TIGR02466 family)